MKTNYFFKTLAIILFISNYLAAQNKCCLGTTVAPELSTVGTGVTIGLNQSTAPPVFYANASADLPNVEYVIARQGQVALDGQGQPSTVGGGGNVIIGVDEDGIFVPANQNRYGLSVGMGDYLDVTAVGYNLPLIQELTDSLLNGFSNGQPCCGLFGVMSLVLQNPGLAGFCNTLNNAGIYTGADVTNLEDVLTVFSPFVDGQYSVGALIYVFDLINSNGNYVSTDCGGTGGNNFLSYGLSGIRNFTYIIGATPTSNTCCYGTTMAPELNTGIHGTLIATNDNTPLPALAVNASADLTNVEYIITKRNTAALDAMGQPDTIKGGGDVVLGADEDGVFMPMDKTRYGLTLAVGDTFDMTAIGYDLPAFKILMDSLLNGTQNGQPCCDVFSIMASVLNKPHLGAVCNRLNNAGILGAGDLNNMEEMLPVFEALNNNQNSLGSIVAALELLNENGNSISSDCGGTGMNNFMPYGIHLKKQYAYVVDNPLVVRDLSPISLFMIYPNPTTTGLLNVHFTMKKEVNVVVRLFDALGQEVHYQTLEHVLGDVKTTISTQHLATGVYFLELADGHSKQVTKVVVD